MRKIKVLSCIMVVAVMALIFFFSSENADNSTETSMDVTEKIVEIATTVIGNSEPKLNTDKVQVIVRKTAHFSLYFWLSLFSANACAIIFGKHKKRAFYVLAFCLCYAISDEFHQYFVPGRTAKVFDVGIDFIGSLIGYIAFGAVCSLWKRRKNT